MSTGSIYTDNGLNLFLKRMYRSSETIVSQFQQGTGTNTPIATDTSLQTAIGAKINFVTGYPVFDTTNKRVSLRGFVNSGTNNGNTITEVGTYNTDGTPVMATRDVHTAKAKTANIEMAYIWVNSITQA